MIFSGSSTISSVHTIPMVCSENILWSTISTVHRSTPRSCIFPISKTIFDLIKGRLLVSAISSIASCGAIDFTAHSTASEKLTRRSVDISVGHLIFTWNVAIVGGPGGSSSKRIVASGNISRIFFRRSGRIRIVYSSDGIPRIFA